MLAKGEQMAAETKRQMAANMIREARLEKGWSQNKTSLLTGLHPATVHTAETAGVVTQRTAALLGKALGLVPDDIVTSE
jgi:transcriptional regulator with XRE-family HTH domain